LNRRQELSWDHFRGASESSARQPLVFSSLCVLLFKEEFFTGGNGGLWKGRGWSAGSSAWNDHLKMTKLMVHENWVHGRLANPSNGHPLRAPVQKILPHGGGVNVWSMEDAKRLHIDGPCRIYDMSVVAPQPWTKMTVG